MKLDKCYLDKADEIWAWALRPKEERGSYVA